MFLLTSISYFKEMIHIADFTKKGKVTEKDFKVIMQKTKMY